MRYLSTRGGAPLATFDEVLTRALSPDGGLYVPEVWPEPRDWSAFRGQPFEEVAAEVLSVFAGDTMQKDEARALCDKAFASFRHPDRVPVVPVGDQHLLELFHGPTLAFKDVAMQLIGHLFERALSKRSGEMTVVVATSGDTGGAAVSALAGRSNVRIVVLHPHERISEVQRRFMTTTGARNVLNLAVEGTFDDCQTIVKSLFADTEFASEVALGGVNSINWARITAQVSYYIAAGLAFDRTIGFSVPTGNFGDVFAGYVAKKLGAPVDRLIVAVNANDILDRALRHGIYEKRGVTRTTSPSMDIEIASNFERSIFEASGRDARLTSSLMARLSQEGGFALPDHVHTVLMEDFYSHAVPEEDVADEMRNVWRENAMLIDPHTAIGLRAARLAGAGDAPVIALSTAHPAKFPDAVKAATGQTPALPEGVQDLFARDEEFTVVPADAAAIKNAIRAQ